MKHRKIWITAMLSSFVIILYFNMFRTKNMILKQNDSLEASQNDTKKTPLNIILLTYYRSGSTLLGELLSTIESTYYFEPLYYICVLEKSWCLDSEFRSKYMEKLINCNGSILFDFVQKMWIPIVRKMNSITNIIDFFKFSPAQLGDLCRQSQIHVYKTTRMRVADALKILKAGNSLNIKIVHLVRDPRAKYNSEKACLLCKTQDFSIQRICEEMEIDLRDSYSIPKQLYTRLRYEDLVQDPIGQMNSLFQRVYGHEIGNATLSYINLYMGKVSSTAKYEQNFKLYYGTNRSLGINVDKWKTELSKQEINLIQDRCKYVLDELNYT